MADLNKITTEQLEAELARRNNTASAAPVPLANPDFSKLIETVISGTEQSIADEYEDEDLDHYICEAAYEAVYGKEYWVWRRAQKW